MGRDQTCWLFANFPGWSNRQTCLLSTLGGEISICMRQRALLNLWIGKVSLSLFWMLFLQHWMLSSHGCTKENSKQNQRVCILGPMEKCQKQFQTRSAGTFQSDEWILSYTNAITSRICMKNGDVVKSLGPNRSVATYIFNFCVR